MTMLETDRPVHVRHEKYERLIARAQEAPAATTIVVHPCDETSLRGAVEAAEAGIIIPVLVGPRAKIEKVAHEAGLDISRYTLVDAPHSEAAAAQAVALIREGKGELLMKGSLHTDELMRAVTSGTTGLRTARRISHVFIMDVPTYPDALFITDAAINIFPDLKDKRDIVQNAIDLFTGLGMGVPRVALLSAVETVTPDIPSTIEAAALCKMAERGQITGGVLDGPLAFDNADGVGMRPRLRAADGDGGALIDKAFESGEIPDLEAAIFVAGAWLRETQKVDLVAVGHRVVHGGPDFDGPVLVDADVISRLERYISLAPLHQPHNLAPMRALLERRPNMPQVACFDTSFHRGHGALADHYALPLHFYEEGIRRYGFHGLSYEYIADRLRQIAPGVASGRVIVAHLGSGASMCAIEDGRSVESTLGFTALDGLPMGTRPGQIDPGVVLYLIMEKDMSPGAVQDMLYRECGLKGLSGISNDVRELEASADPKAVFALDFFAYRVGLNAGMLAAAMGGLDGFVFTAGIGENSTTMRARIAQRLAWLGVELDAEANRQRRTVISTRESRVPVYVAPTNEELMIARHTVEALSKQTTLRAKTAG